METPSSPPPPGRPWTAHGDWSAPEPSRPGHERWSEPDMAADPADAGYIPPDPDEPPPFDLWATVGHIAPWGTRALLACWALVYALTAVRGDLADPAALLLWGASATGLAPADAAWRLLASTFLHGGFGHVFFNGLTLLVLGPAVERLFARPSFWIVYAAGGAAASLASLAWRGARVGGALSLSVGGSGALFAMAGAVLAAAVRLRGRLGAGRARALGGALLFLVMQSLAGGATQVGTDTAAHLGGLLAGALLGAAVPLSEPLTGRRPGVVARALGALCVLAMATALALALRGGLRLG